MKRYNLAKMGTFPSREKCSSKSFSVTRVESPVTYKLFPGLRASSLTSDLSLFIRNKNQNKKNLVTKLKLKFDFEKCFSLENLYRILKLLKWMKQLETAYRMHYLLEGGVLDLDRPRDERLGDGESEYL